MADEPQGTRKMTRLFWLFPLFLSVTMAWATTAWSAQVYRYVDDEGNVSYSDRPQSETAESVFVAAQRPPSLPSRMAPERTADDGSGEAASAEDDGEIQRELREPTPEERAEDRARNCAIAQERAERYAVSHRLYRETPDGEREYLDDAQLTEARTQAVADVEKWCD